MAAEPRFLVFGGSGHLGTALVHDLTLRSLPVAAPARAEVDLLRGDLAAVIDASSPAAVINAAAYNDVNGAEAESNRNEAFRMNRDVPDQLARVCAGREIPLVHVSTDYVFDGRKREPYREDDPVAPLQHYGRTKLEGERAVVAAHPGALVVRTSTVFGADRRGGSNYIDAVLTRARSAGGLEVVRLPESSPTYALDLSRALLALLDVGATGLVHVANAGGCSRLELATEAVRLAGLAGKAAIRERSAPPTGPPRPAYSVLDTARYAALTGRSMRAWQDALREYLTGR